MFSTAFHQGEMENDKMEAHKGLTHLKKRFGRWRELRKGGFQTWHGHLARVRCFPTSGKWIAAPVPHGDPCVRQFSARISWWVYCCRQDY
jgi:hypothetical protein